jgi:hypothetical protein
MATMLQKELDETLTACLDLCEGDSLQKEKDILKQINAKKEQIYALGHADNSINRETLERCANADNWTPEQYRAFEKCSIEIETLGQEINDLRAESVTLESKTLAQLMESAAKIDLLRDTLAIEKSI